ncbi:hypothetical protein [Aulosira sp. FACHB-615]|uniref:hypothetical protein n=1 Tax=Aulosira sp. FACHB-615 TaxID=2692777 RepID=UPI001F54B508|nr:hypothetical protein [Aulosira sp. FACHB-615]
MKSLAKIFVAFLVAVTIAFGGFYDHANAASYPYYDDYELSENIELNRKTPIPISVSIDANQTIDQIINLVHYSQKFVIEVANQTKYPLIRVGTYNDSSNWPVGDVSDLHLVGEQFSGTSVGGSFSFAANYAIGDTGKYVQFAASWPYIGSRKIHLKVINQTGNEPAKIAWKEMDNASDKNLNNDPFQARAFMAQKGDSVIWVYNVRNLWSITRFPGGLK